MTNGSGVTIRISMLQGMECCKMRILFLLRVIVFIIFISMIHVLSVIFVIYIMISSNYTHINYLIQFIIHYPFIAYISLDTNLYTYL